MITLLPRKLSHGETNKTKQKDYSSMFKSESRCFGQIMCSLQTVKACFEVFLSGHKLAPHEQNSRTSILIAPHVATSCASFFSPSEAAPRHKMQDVDSAEPLAPLPYFILRLKYVLDNVGGGGRAGCKAARVRLDRTGAATRSSSPHRRAVPTDPSPRRYLMCSGP